MFWEKLVSLTIQPFRLLHVFYIHNQSYKNVTIDFVIMTRSMQSVISCSCQHAHSYFCLGVHVPPGVSIWGYMFIFEGTHILELFFHSKRIEAMKSDHLDVYNSDIIML